MSSTDLPPLTAEQIAAWRAIPKPSQAELDAIAAETPEQSDAAERVILSATLTRRRPFGGTCFNVACHA